MGASLLFSTGCKLRTCFLDMDLSGVFCSFRRWTLKEVWSLLEDRNSACLTQVSVQPPTDTKIENGMKFCLSCVSRLNAGWLEELGVAWDSQFLPCVSTGMQAKFK